MQNLIPLTQDLVLIGGGHTHALVLRKWGMNPLAGVRVTVINPGPTAPYTGMLPGFVAGHYTRDELDIDLVRLCRFSGARLINGAARAIDRSARTITVDGYPPIPYDVAAIDIGITSSMPDLAGFGDYAVPAKPLGVFATGWEAYRASAKSPRIAVIGGGVAGVELAMAMTHALLQDGHKPQTTVIDRAQALKDVGASARHKLQGVMQDMGITVIEGAMVAGVTNGGVQLVDGRLIASDFTTGAAGARPHGWLAYLGLDMTDGFIDVNAALQSSDPAIFAVGDCAHLTVSPRPKAGVFAVREAPVLFDNLRAVLMGRPLRDYRPQRDYLKLISLGAQSALAQKWGRAVQGPLLWRWKDRIDRTFMDQFTTLGPMQAVAIPRDIALGVTEALGDKPMCGGCGAKVGRGALARVLAQLPATMRDDVHSVRGDDAAILATGNVRQIMTTDHLRALCLDHVMMTRIAVVHALGDAWAMGAAVQAVTINVILPRMSATLHERTLTDIMATAHGMVADAGGAIVGGHTSVGEELTIGLTVTGLCEKAPITLAGAKAGDALILTKPIGSGVVMAAEMAGQARGGDVVAAWGAMTEPQGSASAILCDAHAMTDVTGFGLAGHLAGICAASGVAAQVDLDAVPMMPGAVALSAAGVRSTIYASNRADAGPVFGAICARGDLLFDPQTGGGLLAAVASKDADGLCIALQQAGYRAAAIIGQIVAGDPAISVQT